MSGRTLHPKGLVFALLLVQTGAVSAQVDPADMRSGVHSFSSQSLPAFFTVPMGSTLVLTDITWSTTMVSDHSRTAAGRYSRRVTFLTTSVEPASSRRK